MRSHKYPCEKHSVITDDGFKLTLFRISNPNAPVVTIFHGLFSSSDCFILCGPDNSIAFKLYDAGYDVWLGNFRGNDYSQEGVLVWSFGWHEMGFHDTPAMIDYVLETSGQQSAHYVAHSMGATAFFVMASLKPNYVSKLKTIHLFSPAVFMLEVKSPLPKLFSLLAQYNNAVITLVGNVQFLPGLDVINLLAPAFCQQGLDLDLCKNVLFLFAGGPSSNTNDVRLPWILFNFFFNNPLTDFHNILTYMHI